jgi:trigger factor
MKVKEKANEDGTLHLSITATAQEVNKALDRAEAAVASRFGLRPDPSKSAAQALAEHLEIGDVDTILQSQALNMLIPFALEQRCITPLAQPKAQTPTGPKRNQAFSFQIDVLPKPHFTLNSYEPVEITVPAYEPAEIDVDAEIRSNMAMYTEFETAEPHPVRQGDSCLIAIDVFQDGERLSGISTDSRVYSTGKGYMPEDFERQVIGMDVGETKEFSFEAEDLDEDGNTFMRAYDCKVTVKEIQKEVFPELDDEWVKRAMPLYSSLDELRAEVRTSYETQMLRAYDNQVLSIAQAKLGERLEGKIPDEAYESTYASIQATLQNQLTQQGKSLADFIEEQGGEQNYKIGIMMQTRQTLRCDYALDALFEYAGLEVTDEDIDAACAEMNPMNPAAVKREMESSGRGFALREVAARYAASRYLVDNAIITVEGAES